MKLTITQKGNKRIIYCSTCHYNKLPILLGKYKEKVLNNPKTNYLLEACDNLTLSTDTRDLAGGIFPDQFHVHSAPNGHRLILRPTEYAAIHVKPSPSKAVETKRNVTVNSLVPNKKCEMVTKESVTLKPKVDVSHSKPQYKIEVTTCWANA